MFNALIAIVLELLIIEDIYAPLFSALLSLRKQHPELVGANRKRVTRIAKLGLPEPPDVARARDINAQKILHNCISPGHKKYGEFFAR